MESSSGEQEMKSIYMIITNQGDGSNGIRIVKDKEVLDKMYDLATDGDEYYASGDGLQVRELTFPDDFDVDTWVNHCFSWYTTKEDML